jgi:hypothetical protein
LWAPKAQPILKTTSYWLKVEGATMSVEPHLLLLASKPEGWRPELEALPSHLLAAGYHLAQFRVGSYQNPDLVWPGSLTSEANGLSLAYQQREIALTMRPAEGQPEVSLSIGWWGEANATQIVMSGSVYQTRLYREAEAALYSRRLLDLGHALYEWLQPDFGWIDFNQPGGQTWFDDLQRLELPHLYWATYFGASYLEQLGKNKVLALSHWKSQALPDGGLLLIMSEALG